MKESESTNQDITLPLPNQEHVTIIYTTMATCAASTRSSSRKTKKNANNLISPTLTCQHIAAAAHLEIFPRPEEFVEEFLVS